MLKRAHGFAFTQAVEQFGKNASTFGSLKSIFKSPVSFGLFTAFVTSAFILAGFPFVSSVALTTAEHKASPTVGSSTVAPKKFDDHSIVCPAQAIVTH